MPLVRKDLKFLFVIIATTAIGYITGYGGDFCGDDSIRITDFTINRDSLVEFVFSSMPERPLLMASLYLNYLMSELNPISFKVFSILLHAITGFLVFILLRIFNRYKLKIENDNVSLFASLIFVLSPINSQVIVTVVQRGVILSTLFGLLSTLFAFKYYKENDRKNILLSSLMILLSVLSKPNGAFFAIFNIMFIKIVLDIDLKRLMKQNLPSFLYIWFPVFMLLGVGRDHYVSNYYSSIEYFFYQISTFFIYIKNFFEPFNLYFYRVLNVENVYIAPKTLLAILAHFLILFYVIRSIRRKSYAALLIVFLYFFMIPESSFFSIKHLYFDHRFYVSSIFLSSWLVVTFYNFFKLKHFRLLSIVFISYLLVGNLYQLDKVKTKVDFEMNSFMNNKDQFDMAMGAFSVAFAEKRFEVLEKIVRKENWKFDEKFDGFREILNGMVKINSYSVEKKKKLLEAALKFLHGRTFVENYKLDGINIAYHIIFNSLLVDEYLKKMENSLYIAEKIELAMRKNFKIFIAHPSMYTYLILNYKNMLKYIASSYLKDDIREKGDDFYHVLGQLECMGRVGEKLKTRFGKNKIFNGYERLCKKLP